MGKDIKSKLRAGELSLGSWITLRDPAVAEIMARAGFDWLVVDLEHSVIGIEVAAELIRTIDLCGVAPLVRLTSNDPDQIKRVMDAGAQGVVVPMVKTAAEASRAVAATRYGPAGFRGVGLARAQGYGTAFQDYLRWQTDGPVVVVQIEHKDAIQELAAILAVPGVDAFLIGPYDLSCSMGIPGEFDRPEFIDVLAVIRETGRKAGCAAGFHLVEPDPAQLAKVIHEGFTLVAYSVDMRVLDIGMRTGVRAAQDLR